jgi:hypothetical protein
VRRADAANVWSATDGLRRRKRPDRRPDYMLRKDEDGGLRGGVLPFRMEGEILACIRVDIQRKSPEVQAKQARRMRLSRYSMTALRRSRA